METTTTHAHMGIDGQIHIKGMEFTSFSETPFNSIIGSRFPRVTQICDIRVSSKTHEYADNETAVARGKKLFSDIFVIDGIQWDIVNVLTFCKTMYDFFIANGQTIEDAYKKSSILSKTIIDTFYASSESTPQISETEFGLIVSRMFPELTQAQ